MVTVLIQVLIDSVAWLLSAIILLFPSSPFRLLDIAFDNDIISAINFFLPIKEIVGTLEAWIVAITFYYIIMVIGRWVKIFN